MGLRTLPLSKMGGGAAEIWETTEEGNNIVKTLNV